MTQRRAQTKTEHVRPPGPELRPVSDLENDLDPLIEGIRLATKLGNEVYVVALFPTVFETSENVLANIEALHASYEKHRLRINKMREIKGVTSYESR